MAHSRYIVACLIPSILAVTARGGENHSADVVVYGATSAGVIAAATVAREGKSVLLLDPAGHIGGMTAGGLGATDAGKREAVGGMAREFYRRVHDYYSQRYGQNSPQVRDCSDGFWFEPHVASLTFRAMLSEAKIDPRLNLPIEKVIKDGPRIKAIVMANSDQYFAKVFIDATYEGDLMAKTGVSYHVGREGRAQYNESLAGVQAHSAAHQWAVKVDALGSDGKPLPFVSAGPLAPPGTGDNKIQAYNFRLCMTRNKANSVPWPKPSNFDPKQYELLARYLKAKPDLTLQKLCHPVKMPNGKTDTNNNGPFSTDHIGANYAYADADAATRRQIWQDHVDYTQGFFYFLAHDERVPQALRDETNSWGLAKDEFQATGNWPPQLYVREARRMIGDYVMTQADIMDHRAKLDAVGLGSYNTDSHHVQRVAMPDGSALNEGDFQVRVLPYAIPYRSLTPKKQECCNLLVPICCSASHVAYGTIRMEPVYMILGQACGVAAKLASDGDGIVQHVQPDRLQELLKSQKAILDPKVVTAQSPKSLDVKKLGGIVVDDEGAAKSGAWVHSESARPFVGEGYLHDGNAKKGELFVSYRPVLPSPGRYEIFIVYAPHANRATNVPVHVRGADGVHKLVVNQRRQPPDGAMHRLGEFRLNQESSVQIRNDGTDGYVIADAIVFVPMK